MSMWLTPCARASSMPWSASAWSHLPRAAAPKMMTLLMCPVRPKLRLSISVSDLFSRGRGKGKVGEAEGATAVASIGREQVAPPRSAAHVHAAEIGILVEAVDGLGIAQGIGDGGLGPV